MEVRSEGDKGGAGIVCFGLADLRRWWGLCVLGVCDFGAIVLFGGQVSSVAREVSRLMGCGVVLLGGG